VYKRSRRVSNFIVLFFNRVFRFPPELCQFAREISKIFLDFSRAFFFRVFMIITMWCFVNINILTFCRMLECFKRELGAGVFIYIYLLKSYEVRLRKIYFCQVSAVRLGKDSVREADRPKI